MTLARGFAPFALLVLTLPSLQGQDVVVEAAPPPEVIFVAPPPERWWFNASLDIGSTRPQRMPAQVISKGYIAYGNVDLDPISRLGFTLGGGAWFDADRRHGFDASFFFLEEGGNEFMYEGPGDAVIQLPAINGATGGPAFFQLAGPLVGSGAFQVFAETKYQSADVNYRHSLVRTDNVILDAVAGYRYAHVGEGLHLYNKRLGWDGQIIRTKDHISTANHFHGGQIGLTGELWNGNVYLAYTAKLGLGAVVSTTQAEGAFRVNGDVDPYGFYTRPAVAGDRSYCDFAVMPVGNLTVGKQLGPHARIFVGFEAQYLSRIRRPADVIDYVPVLNGIGNPAARDVRASDFWVQTVNLGMEWRY